MKQNGIKIIKYDSVYAENTVRMWRQSKERALGKKLLDLAKANSKGSLTLYTFEINHKAQRFYERNGFKIIGRGYENEENLDDIKYEWVDSDENYRG